MNVSLTRRFREIRIALFIAVFINGLFFVATNMAFAG